MNQSATQLLLTLILIMLGLGMFVLLTFRDYREGLIIESNRAYMPAIKVENINVQVAEVTPLPDPPEGNAP